MTQEELSALKRMGIYELRVVLRNIGGTPGTKSKNTLISEIEKIKDREQIPHRSPRGRKPVSGKSLMNEMGELRGRATETALSSGSNEPSFVLPEGFVGGVLEIHPDGYGFLRTRNYANTPSADIFVSPQIIKGNKLRRGDLVVGKAEHTRDCAAASLAEIATVNGDSVDAERRNFDDLTPCFPKERINLSSGKGGESHTLRMVDLLCPIGKGQRGLIVAPPKTGKTTLLKSIAQAIEANHPEVHLIVLLIDERPEEVTDFRRSVRAEVVSSTFDESAERHVHAAELVMWRVKRLVEMGKDVVVLLDSITRLTRAYNHTVAPSGKVLSGGIDPAALQLPKKFFGAARNLEEGGSLTVLATALVETGSKMDDVIYEEFKGTGNMEIYLDRALAERRIFPAIDLLRSGTRKDELMLDDGELECAAGVRRFLNREDGLKVLADMINKTESNSEFVERFAAWVELIER